MQAGGDLPTKVKREEFQQVIVLSPVVQSVRIFGFHPEDPGSIPGRGANFLFCFKSLALMIM